MKQKKSIRNYDVIAALGLTLLTLGVYGIFWFIDFVDDLNDLKKDKSAMSGGATFFWIFISFGIYGWYWAYTTSKEINNILVKKRINHKNYPFLNLILAIFLLNIINVAMFQNSINKINEKIK